MSRLAGVRQRVPRYLMALWVCVSVGQAATTATWELTGYQDFLRGRMQGLSLTRDGRLTLGPKLDSIYTSDQAEIWSIARGPDGSVYLGTGNRGRLYKLDPAGKATLLWTADQPEIFAVAVDSKGVVYAGTSPDGKIFRIENGQASEYFAPGVRYIWALAVAPDGALFAATGDQGKIFRITGPGQGSVYYDTGQSNVTALAFDHEGRLLAGSDPNGILYRITGPQKAFVLYDANFPEIRSILPMPDGSVYAAALGGSVAKRASAAASASTASAAASLPVVSTSITVTDQQAGISPLPTPEAPKPAPATPATTTTTTTIDYSGVEKSALYKIAPDNTVETLWTSKEENVYDLASSKNSILFLTDVDGRVYRLEPDRKSVILAETRESDATRLLDTPQGPLVATGALAKVFRLGSASGNSGWFESPVHDSGAVARWGRLSWRGSLLPGAVSFRTRTGNTARPDATWSDWSAPLSDPDRSMIASPNARYIQWRAEMASASSAPMLDSVTIAYLPQNTAPVMRSITVSAQGAKPGSTSALASSNAYSITVTDTGEAPAAAGTATQTISRGAGQQIQVSWQADDPEGDKLIYSVYFRGEDEAEWKLLRGNITENTYLLDGDVLADGRYFFRVTASDRPSNAADAARETELVSAPVVIDNTPPVVTPSAPVRTVNGVDIVVDAEDRASSLRRCEYSVDANPWTPVEASDGVTDSPRERFNIVLKGLPPGEHLVVIRVYDGAGNAGLAKVVVR
jgi:hypothetical protein